MRYEGPNQRAAVHACAPFGVFDLDARREIRPGAEIFAAAENLFDRQYTVNLQGGLESLGLPRTVRGGLSLRSF